jgi:hypothetical protein
MMQAWSALDNPASASPAVGTCRASQGNDVSEEVAMGKRQIVAAAGAAVIVAVGWLVTSRAADKAAEVRRVEVYPLTNIDARVAAESLNRLLGGREDVRITADRKANALLIVADEKDQATLRAFLALVDRAGPRVRIDFEPPPKMMFPEEVERAMMGEAHQLQRMWRPESKAESERMGLPGRKPELKWDEYKWDVPKPSKP